MLTKTVPEVITILNAKQVAKLLGVHERTIYRMVQEGKMPGFKFGGKWRFDAETIKHWINQQMVKNCTKG